MPVTRQYGKDAMVRPAGYYELYTIEQGWVFVSGQTGEDGDRLATT
jgi:enamine deaminase RidA (YjgF/YER057c/UK114 family)